jgi:hypothetical protein
VDGDSTDVESGNSGGGSNTESASPRVKLFDDLSDHKGFAYASGTGNEKVLTIHCGVEAYFLL